MKKNMLFLAIGFLGMAALSFAKEEIKNMNTKIKDTIFHEYDIRGIVGEELVIEETYALARSIAYYFKMLNPEAKIVAIGMDGRTHSPQIKENLCRGLRDSGMDVVFIGVCTTPMFYFAGHTLPVDAGLMITASHNPKEYNGIKIRLGTTSLWGKQIKEIGKLYRENKQLESNMQGTYSEHSIQDAYVAWHVDHFSNLQNSELPIVIDCANGAAGVVMPQLIKELGWKNVHLLYEEVDGNFPNHEADPVVEKNMQDVKKILQTTDAVIGVGFDGDADRVGAMTKNGDLIPGDKLLSIFAQFMVKSNPGMGVVYNVICSAGLGELLKEWGARGYMVPVGRSAVEEKMFEYKAILGGETSCHIFFKDRHFGYDDGIYAMLRLVEVVLESGKTLQELLAVFPKKVTSPEFRIPCKEEDKSIIVESAKKWFFKQKYTELLTIDGVRVTMDYGWGIIRASNTQPVLSIRFESDTQMGLAKIKEDFIHALSEYYDEADLRKQLHLK